MGGLDKERERREGEERESRGRAGTAVRELAAVFVPKDTCIKQRDYCL